MATEKRQSAAQAPEREHRVVLEQGRKLIATGVTEILRFDETAVLLRLSDRLLSVYGEDLELKQLLPDRGNVEIVGSVAGLHYGEGPVSGGFLRRLFG